MEYLQCIYRDKCESTGLCVNQLTGGAGQGAQNDFGLGSENLQTLSRDAASCTDMNPFLTNACTTVSGCCSNCAPLIAGVVEAVTNGLLLPVYNGAAWTLPGCSGMTCPAGRVRDLEEGSTTTTDSISSAETGNDSSDVVDLATECNDSLAQDIVVYNEMYAVDNFFECLTKKMGTIMSEADNKMIEQGVEESSSASFFFDVASLSVSVIVSSIISFVTY